VASIPHIDFLLVGNDQETLERDQKLLLKAGYDGVHVVSSGVDARNVLKSAKVGFIVVIILLVVIIVGLTRMMTQHPTIILMGLMSSQ